MPAVVLPLSVDQGATFRARITVNTTQLDVNGNPIPQDLTGCTAAMTVKASYVSSAPALLSLTTEDDGLTLGRMSGTIDIYASAVQMAAIPVNVGGLTPAQQMALAGSPPTQQYVYDLTVTFPSGDDYRVCVGPFTVAAAVTNP